MRRTDSKLADARAPRGFDPLDDDDDDPLRLDDDLQPTPRRRGRPRKNTAPYRPASADPLAVVDLAPLPADLEKMRLITIAEAQAVLSCSRMTIWNLRQAGRLRTVAIGNAARVPLADVQHVIRTSTEGI